MSMKKRNDRFEFDIPTLHEPVSTKSIHVIYDPGTGERVGDGPDSVARLGNRSSSQAI